MEALECTYKLVAIIIKQRLVIISEQLDQESQCGFRPKRGGTDARTNVRMAVLKRKEHDLETWMFLLDIAKAFDRVPLALLWKIMSRLGVPAKLIVLLRALHGEGGMERRAFNSKPAATRLGDSYGSTNKHRLKALRQSAVSETAVRGATRDERDEC